MIYIVALLLLVLVLANETARLILFRILIYGGLIAVVCAAILALFVFGYEFINSEFFEAISSSISSLSNNFKKLKNNSNSNVIVSIVLLGLVIFLAYDQYKLHKK